MDKDLFDDFDFKPITDGLGFHKKKLQIDEKALRDIQWKTDVELPEISFEQERETTSSIESSKPAANAQTMSQQISYPSSRLNLIDDGEINLDKVRSEFQQKAKVSKTLPRKDIAFTKQEERVDLVKAKSSLSPMAEENYIDKIQSMKGIESRVEESQKMKENLRKIEKAPSVEVSGNWFAAMIDFVVIFGVINLFLSSLLFVTKMDVFSIIAEGIHDPMTQLSLLSLALGSCFLYVVAARSLLGCTLGDWALDIQLGKAEERASAAYPFRVLWRFLVNLCLGFFLLPVLSVLFRKDLAGVISGIRLHKLED